MNIVLPERALYEFITCLANRNEQNRPHEQNDIAIFMIYDLSSFAKSSVLRLTMPNNKVYIAFKRNKIEAKYMKIGRKTERKTTANVNMSRT